MNSYSLHSFHIPVMGLAFTIDSPAKVARFGISSVISVLEDSLIEKMRGYYYGKRNEEYKPITNKEEDYRAKRITDYLDLLNKMVKEQIDSLKASTFDAGSDLVLYFEMLPNDSKLKQVYLNMLETDEGRSKEKLQNFLRSAIRPGSIDINIMTKIDKNNYGANGEIIDDGSDAIAALRGFANSSLTDSSVVFSAGMNPRLYNYIERFNQFITPKKGQFEKKIVIKVSDYRSALIQGKYLAKKGIWVSEFRIESGLNCGGHAFATEGYLLGPILEEFKTNRQEFIDELFQLYKQALINKEKEAPTTPPTLKITVQGGIGTYEEDQMLQEYYNVDGTGWGSPFLLVPEATTVDENMLKLLSESKKGDVVLSKSSPLGVRFNYLKGTSGDNIKKERINSGNPGSLCTEQIFPINTEFAGKPVCVASSIYQKQKLKQLQESNLSEKELARQTRDVLAKECLCVGLSNSAFLKYGMEPFKGNTLNAIVCPGPNITYFSKIASLKQMTDHIYGRINLLKKDVYRPHMFINELELYVNYLEEQLQELSDLDNKTIKYYQNFCNNLLDGINYYKKVATTAFNLNETSIKNMLNELNLAEKKVETLIPVLV